MPASLRSSPYICSRCLRARPIHNVRPRLRAFTTSPPRHDDGGATQAQPRDEAKAKEPGAFSARMQQMSEEALETGGRSARKAIEEADFDPDLKKRLEERIAGASFRSNHASAFAQVELPSSAGRAARDVAVSAPWSGSESVQDASRRMLQDAYKPLRVPRSTTPGPGPRLPTRVDTGRSASRPNTGARLANARDQTSVYATLKDSGMSPKEREQYRKEMKARFRPDARTAPATLSGLASLANERIEDAIARGQFKNLPRGKGKHIERDHAANSPFLDTTEYFMNKIIQRQEIVPPWIEKQQELLSTADKFRARLRNDWKRHAARMVAAQGGSLEMQVARARAYAAAEEIANPSKKKIDTLDIVSDEGHLSQITLTGQLKTPETSAMAAPEMQIQVEETSILETPPPDAPTSASTTPPKVTIGLPPPVPRTAQGFRDPTWEANELSFHVLTIKNLNSICRTYNLMAPGMAQKPYYSLDRELKSCFADVAPLLPGEILERATRPKIKVEVISHAPGSFLEQNFSHRGRVYDEDIRRKGYGFRQFWQDLWRKDENSRAV